MKDTGMTLKTLTDLYSKGTVVVLKDDSLLWLQKLTPYEQGVVRQKAAVARARAMLALKEVGSDELALMDLQVAELDDATLVDALVTSMFGELYQEVAAELAIEEDWQERHQIRTGTDRSTLVPGSPEDELLTRLETEYAEELQSRMANRQEIEKQRLLAAGRPQVEADYREGYIEAAGRNAFMEAFNAADLFYMVRRCRATSDGPGRYNHDTCSHLDRYFAAVEDLHHLDEDLVELLRKAENEITMSVSDARFLGSPESSSDSSAPPSAPEASAPSSPTTPTSAGT